MDLWHFEDYPIGLVREFGAYEVTAENIVAFAREFDPQPFHLDEEAARNSLLGGLAASGWQTGAIMMRLNCDDWALRTASMGGPGVDEMRWLKPVRPGHVLHCRMTVTDTRVSRSRPEMGLVGMFVELMERSGELLATMKFTGMFLRRDPAAPIPSENAPRPKPVPSPVLPEPVDLPPVARIGHLEDLEIGARLDLGSYRFERARMIAFARDWDPQPFHIDDAAAESSHFGRLSASGWQTGGAFMQRWIHTRQKLAEAMRAQGQTPPQWGPSPGFRDLRWLRPVYAGDVIRYSTLLTDKRRITRPGWGLVTSYNEGTNQDGVKVFEFTSAALCPTRG